MANKVLFGFSDLYVGTYEDDGNGNITMGTPYHQAGAVGFAPESNSEQETFYADNVPYYVYYTAGTVEGDLTVAMFDDAFKKQFLGYVELDDGGIAQVKGVSKPAVYCCFEVQGDDSARRVILYNGKLSDPTREYATTEDTAEPQTESVSASFVGDNATGITMVTYKEGDAGYAKLFTNPPAPDLPSGY